MGNTNSGKQIVPLCRGEQETSAQNQFVMHVGAAVVGSSVAVFGTGAATIGGSIAVVGGGAAIIGRRVFIVGGIQVLFQFDRTKGSAELAAGVFRRQATAKCC